MRCNLKTAPKTDDISIREWIKEFKREIVEILNLAENQIEVWRRTQMNYKKPKKVSEYERIECVIYAWENTRLLCKAILGEGDC